MARLKKAGDLMAFPPGVKDITEDISIDDLTRRLKDCASAFQSMSQDDDNSVYIPLALHLATECFLEHSSKDIQLLTACCIADVFRVFAPEPPYKDPVQLKTIFYFFVEELKGLEDPKSIVFKRHFYLLENLAWVKTFNICIELEENQAIICNLYNVFFSVYNSEHSVKVKTFMLDILTPLIIEADTVSQELLDVILEQLIEPHKSNNQNAYTLAQDVLKRTSATIEPYIQGFFNSALILGKTADNEVGSSIYELIYELNSACPNLLVSVMPQLEFKLKSNAEEERLQVTDVLAKLLSNKDSKLMVENKMLWKSFIGRFNDISAIVRKSVVRNSMAFFINHPELSEDIEEQLRLRTHDQDENIRYEVVKAVLATARENLDSVSAVLLNCVKERTLDKNFQVRKEALHGLATLYRQSLNDKELFERNNEKLFWIPEKVLHAYYLISLDDKILVERLLHMCLVPYQFTMEERMERLYHLVTTADEYAIKALKELLKCQNMMGNHFRNILEALQHDHSENRWTNVGARAQRLAKNLQDPVKAHEQVVRFCQELESSLKIKNMMLMILNGNNSCSEIENHVKGILKVLGLPVQTNQYYMTIKQLLERMAPIMIDKEGIRLLFQFVRDSIGTEPIDNETMNAPQRCLDFLQLLSLLFTKFFQQEEIYSNLLLFLQSEDDICVDLTLQIIMNACSDIERRSPQIFFKLVPILENLAETGTVKQAKHAVYCLNTIAGNKKELFGGLIEKLKTHFTLESQYFRTALVSVSHIAYLCHDMFATQLKAIVTQTVVRDLLMLDQDLPRGGKDTWCTLESLPDETKVKIAGMKLMVRWLVGLKSTVQPAISTFRLLSTIILHKGDLMDRQHTAPQENAWLRLTAATCTLKLCQEANYSGILTTDQFQVLSSLICDQCVEVRKHFAQKLHKGLLTMKLPMHFMAMLAICGTDNDKSLKDLVKAFLNANIAKRREYLKQHMLTGSKMMEYLPDYIIPHVIHLLAHTQLKSHTDVPSLLKIKQCLSYVLNPLIVKEDSNRHSFLKVLIESVKKTKDKQDDSEESNFKLYAVSDLALLVLSSHEETVTKDFPSDPVLPPELFTDIDNDVDITKVFLPPELCIPSKAKVPSVELEELESSDLQLSDEAMSDEEYVHASEEQPESPKPENSHPTKRGRGRPRKVKSPTPEKVLQSSENEASSDSLSNFEKNVRYTKRKHIAQPEKASANLSNGNVSQKRSSTRLRTRTAKS